MRDERAALWTFRLMRERRGIFIVIGPWAARFSIGAGHYLNGSQWWSGWHRWRRPETWGDV